MNTPLQCLVVQWTRFWQARKEEEGLSRPPNGELLNTERCSLGVYGVSCAEILCPMDTAGPALKKPAVWQRRDSAAPPSRDAMAGACRQDIQQDCLWDGLCLAHRQTGASCLPNVPKLPSIERSSPCPMGKNGLCSKTHFSEKTTRYYEKHGCL